MPPEWEGYLRGLLAPARQRESVPVEDLLAEAVLRAEGPPQAQGDTERLRRLLSLLGDTRRPSDLRAHEWREVEERLRGLLSDRRLIEAVGRAVITGLLPAETLEEATARYPERS